MPSSFPVSIQSQSNFDSTNEIRLSIHMRFDRSDTRCKRLYSYHPIRGNTDVCGWSTEQVQLLLLLLISNYHLEVLNFVQLFCHSRCTCISFCLDVRVLEAILYVYLNSPPALLSGNIQDAEGESKEEKRIESVSQLSLY